jgi:membrane protein implicated in regulation of membrane protease activity
VSEKLWYKSISPWYFIEGVQLMDVIWIWWIAAVALVALELSTGTVYLLMVALGLAAGGWAAWAGHGFAVQLLVASALSLVGCFCVQRLRARAPAQPESQRNQNVQIDLGNVVQVDAWQADGTAQVQYRGAQWTAKRDVQQGAAMAGAHSIVAMQGNTLVLKQVAIS